METKTLPSPRPSKARGGRKAAVVPSAAVTETEATEVFDGGVISPQARSAEGDDSGMARLFVGDLVTLHLNAVGLVVGDMQLNRLGAEVEETERRGSSSGTFAPADYAFRICPKLTYRAKDEDLATRKRRPRAPSVFSRSVDDGSDSGDEADDDEVAAQRGRVKREREQNAKVLSDLVDPARSSHAALLFGDIIQLQHLRSDRFVGMRKSAAPRRASNKCVALMDDREAGTSCYFRILPRYKARAKGSAVYSLDEVIFESCDYAEYLLSGTPTFDYTRAVDKPDCHLKRSLQGPETLEINGFLRRSESGSDTSPNKPVFSFQVKLFSRGIDERMLSTLNIFRFFHPEYNGFLMASSDRDKGEILDVAAGDRKTLRERRRVGGVPGHIPFLKKIGVAGDPGNSANLSAKAVWRFEPLDENSVTEVQFCSPLHICHVPTNKYLSVLMTKPGALTPEAGSVDVSDEFYDCALVDAHAAPPSSMLFTILPTTETGSTLANTNTNVRIEHRSSDGRRLYMTDIDDVKPPFIGKQTATEETNKPKSRIGFTTRATGLEVLTIMPIGEGESKLLDRLLGCVPIVELYTHRYKTAQNDSELPVDMCESMVRLLLELIDDLVKGKIRVLRDTRKSTSEFIDDINAASSSNLAELFGGEPSVTNQMCCYESKLLDALFECTLAPYNRVFWRIDSGKGPFTSKAAKRGPAAIQKLLFVCLERIIADNQTIIGYFSQRSTRVWKGPTERTSDLWRNLTVEQSDDESGAAVLLSLLFSTSAEVLGRLVDDDLLERFKVLIKTCGPHRRLINLFASVCFVESAPVRAVQEACIRKLWLSETDRYDVMATFHELPDATVVSKALKGAGFGYPFAQLTQPNNTPCPQHCRVVDPAASPAAFLGQTSDNLYAPVGLVWRSSLTVIWGNAEGLSDRGGLYWSPKDMNIPTVGPFTATNGAPIGDIVPVEHLFWVLEPKRLSRAVVGKSFKPFTDFRTSVEPSSDDGEEPTMLSKRRLSRKSFEEADRSLENEWFSRKVWPFRFPSHIALSCAVKCPNSACKIGRSCSLSTSLTRSCCSRPCAVDGATTRSIGSRGRLPTASS